MSLRSLIELLEDTQIIIICDKTKIYSGGLTKEAYDDIWSFEKCKVKSIEICENKIIIEI